ncbi:HAD family hydrolase [Alistipes sp.]|uniref:HAD family hydrolase n=1 Tax=Alistipes sp. TaxID=1872444 RepID=UPI003AF15F27
MNRKYLFFDLDGTLTDSMPGITRGVQYALAHLGIEVDDLKTLLPFIGPPLRDSFRVYYGLDEARIDLAVSKYREYYEPRGLFENAPYEGIPELLQELQSAGFRLVMATSKPEHLARRIASHFGFADRFAHIAGSAADGSRDSKADVIRHAIRTLGIADRREAVMIGDRRHDIEGAAAAGVDAIGVLWGYGSRDELLTAGAHTLAADLGELRRLLLG